jgi:Tfp pilus assembly protein PilX
MNRRPHLLARIRRRLAPETGIALVISLGAMTILGMVGASALDYASQNSGSASRSNADAAALALADAGINNAMAVLSNPSNDPTNAALLSARTDAYGTGTVTWSGTYDASTTTWTLVAVGNLRNPTGVAAAPVTRRITATVPVSAGGAGPIGPLQNPAWDYLTATRTGNPCDMTLSASVTDAAPIYTMGNFCLGSLSSMTAGPLAVRGSLTVGTGTVGSVGLPIDHADVALGCGGHACTSADNVFAVSITQTPPLITPPVANWDYWYANAAPGPHHGCDTSVGVVPVFDNNAVRDKSVATVFSLTPASSYTCRVGPVGSPTGELSWDAPSRVLTVRGTIFIDGQATINNGQVDRYVGQGVLYLSGSLSVANGSKMCAVILVTDCDFTPGAWNTTQNFFGVVSNGNGGTGVLAGNSVQLGCLDRFQGALYGTNAVYFSAGASSAKHQGPIVASTIVLSSSAITYPFGLLTNVPVGLPGQSTSGAKVNPPQNFTN